MKFAITRKTTLPTRGHKLDAGIDIYIPTFTKNFIDLLISINNPNSFTINLRLGELTLYKHLRIKIPTGVYFNIPKNNMLLVLLKTSVPNKTGIISGARVIDLNYQGLFIASLINVSDTLTVLKLGQKFIQLVLTPVHEDRELENTPIAHLYDLQSTRGLGAYGSTGAF